MERVDLKKKKKPKKKLFYQQNGFIWEYQRNCNLGQQKYGEQPQASLKNRERLVL